MGAAVQPPTLPMLVSERKEILGLLIHYPSDLSPHTSLSPYAIQAKASAKLPNRDIMNLWCQRQDADAKMLMVYHMLIIKMPARCLGLFKPARY